ncbi:MAG: MMPL family transporter, partial [Spirochaetia bacterium]|nr:MMPL family transporter [Spirochaetia bacterium]
KNSKDITHVLSFTRYTRYLHEIMTGEFTIPESPGLIMLISRYLSILTELDRNNSDFRLILSEDKNRMTIAFRYRNGETGSLPELENAQYVTDLLEQYRYMLPEDCTATIWGQGSRFLALNELIKSDQRRSTAWSLVIVFLITAVTFSSIKYGLFSLIPIVTGIMANYIFMMSFAIPFDMVTIAFSSVTVGVGIDDAIHFILRFRKVHKKYPDNVRGAVHETLVLTGRPITLTSVSIISGLMVLSLGSFVPIRYFGILISVALFNTLMATLFILPACIILWYTFTEWKHKKQQKTL